MRSLLPRPSLATLFFTLPWVLLLALSAPAGPARAIEALSQGSDIDCNGYEVRKVPFLALIGKVTFIAIDDKTRILARLTIELGEDISRDEIVKRLCADVKKSLGMSLRAAAQGGAPPAAVPDTVFVDVGTTPLDATEAFIDADANPDLVVANRGSNDLTIALGLADGGLDAPFSVATGSGPVRVLPGDLDGINGTDLVTLNELGGDLSVLLQNAVGGFEAPASISPVGVPFDAALGLFDDDDVLDLVVADANAVELAVLIGNGDGSFGSPTPFPVSGTVVVVADVNRDGEADLVTDGNVLLGDGLGGFGSAIPFAGGFDPTQVRVGDLDDDDNPDLVTVSAGSNIVSTQLGAGDGSFGPPLHYAVGNSPSRVEILEADLPGVVVSHAGDDHVTVLAGNGDGSLRGARAHPAVSDLSDRQGALAAAVADFDGDGQQDVVAANGGTAFNGEPDASLLEGLGGGDLAPFVAIPGQDGSRVVAGLWDAGTDPDLAFTVTGSPGIRSSRLEITLGNGDLSFTPGIALDLPDDDRTPDAIATALVDAGALPDLLVANSGTGDVSVFLGDGLGGFAAQPTVAIGTAPNDLVTGFFDDDGDLDLVASFAGQLGLSNGGVSIALGNGDGTFQAATPVRAGGEVDSLAAGDWNGDSETDLAIVIEAQPFEWSVEVLLGDGLGGFGPPASIELGDESLGGLGADDVDGDGDQDLFLTVGGARVVFLLGDGAGDFEEAAFVSTAGGRAQRADLDDDGFDELVSATGAGLVSVRAGENDADGDAIGDSGDNCTLVANPDQENADLDPSGNHCDGDFNQDLFVGGPDFDTFLGCFNDVVGPGAGPAEDPTCAESDMNADGFVGGPDFDLFLQVFNGPPGPNAQGCGLGFELVPPLAALLALRRRRESRTLRYSRSPGDARLGRP